MGKCLHRGKWCFQINLAEVDKIDWSWTDGWRGNQLTGLQQNFRCNRTEALGAGTGKELIGGTFREKLPDHGN